MSKSTQEKLSGLSQEQIDAVSRLIDKFDRRNTKTVENFDDHNKIEKPKNQPEKTVRSSRGRKSPRNPDRVKKSRHKGGKNKGTLARVEPVSISRENKFDRMSERHEEKKDSEIDKKLWEGKQPSLRREEFDGYIEMQCSKCELWFDVHPSFIYNDADLGPLYTCDNCSRG